MTCAANGSLATLARDAAEYAASGHQLGHGSCCDAHRQRPDRVSIPDGNHAPSVAFWAGCSDTRIRADSPEKRANVACPARRTAAVLDNNHSLDIADLRRRFDAAATSFDSADFVHAVTRDGLFRRLEPMVLDAAVVVDLGCATGAAAGRLAKRFRGARIVGVDLSRRMLAKSAARRGWFVKAAFVQADAHALPIAEHSVDIVFSNLLLPWIEEPGPVCREVARILRKDGLFVFSTLGPDSLSELRDAWAGVDSHAHVNRFLDMHDVGDALVRNGLRDPVLDVDRLSVTYASADALFCDLAAVGARNSLRGRRQSLCGRARFEAMRERLERGSGDTTIRLDLELIYGHCWGSGVSPGRAQVKIDATAIPTRRR